MKNKKISELLKMLYEELSRKSAEGVSDDKIKVLLATRLSNDIEISDEKKQPNSD